MTTYRSKIGLELVIPLSIILGSIAALFIVNKIWPGLVIIIAVILFVGHTLINTHYTIRNSSLRIRCGFLYDTTIDVNTIQSIKEMQNAISSPAASLDRMEIRFNGMQTVLISPKDRAGFIRELLLINPAIEIVVRKLY